MRETILQTLKSIEEKEQIKILYAVESGSRAWGFASADSDYDVRYIYIRREEDYLRVEQLRDTIEGPLDEVLDFSGWDVRKMLELLRKCNPSLMEWYRSPIVYLTTPLWENLREIVPGYFQPRSNMHHYLSMVGSNWNTYLKPELERVSAKKYLYVLRPILCCRYLERYGTVPPVPFDTLCRTVLPEDLVPAVNALLEQKKHGEEKALIPRIGALDAFITAETPRLTMVRDSLPNPSLPGYGELNEIFLRLLRDAWE